MEMIDTKALLTLEGMSILIVILTQLFKKYIPDWRWTNLVAMGIGLVLGLIATYALVGLTVVTVMNALLLALVAGAGASGIYEGVKNVAGLLGFGSRAK